MERVIGLGGPFIKANDPKAMTAWYENIWVFHLTELLIPIGNLQIKTEVKDRVVMCFPFLKMILTILRQAKSR